MLLWEFRNYTRMRYLIQYEWVGLCFVWYHPFEEHIFILSLDGREARRKIFFADSMPFLWKLFCISAIQHVALNNFFYKLSFKRFPYYPAKNEIPLLIKIDCSNQCSNWYLDLTNKISFVGLLRGSFKNHTFPSRSFYIE